MAQTGFYNGINLVDTSSVESANLEFNRDSMMREAQDLADEWVRHRGLGAQRRRRFAERL
jgi:hypothetical protein